MAKCEEGYLCDVCGGDVEAGPRAEGGWRVHARLTA